MLHEIFLNLVDPVKGGPMVVRDTSRMLPVSVSLRFNSKRTETAVFRRSPDFFEKHIFGGRKTCVLRETGATMSYGAHTLQKKNDQTEQDGVDENARSL